MVGHSLLADLSACGLEPKHYAYVNRPSFDQIIVKLESEVKKSKPKELSA